MSVSGYIAAFDFDGVIWDSVDECFHVASEVFRRMEGGSSNNFSLKERFRKGRYLVKKGEDFYHLMNLVKDPSVTDLEKLDYSVFLDLREKYSKDALEFGEMFYQERKRLRTGSNDFWKSLQRPFPSVVKALGTIEKKFMKMVICTTKDEESVKDLLSTAGIDIPVYGRGVSTHKPVQIEKICNTYDILPEKILFIDDLPENLLAVKNTGAVTAMAGWGYNSPEGRKIAEDSKIPILDQNRLFEGMVKAIEIFSRKNPLTDKM